MRRAVSVAILVTLAWAARAAAESTKTTPLPGVTHIHRWNTPIRGATQDYHVLLIDLSSPSLRFRVSKESEKNQTVSAIATAEGAALAFNASFFQTDRTPSGPTQSYGTFWSKVGSGYANAIAFGVGKAAIFDSGGKSPWPSAIASFATDGVTGQPWLIKDGKNLGPFTEPASINTRKARTAIGITASGKTIIVVVADGERPTAEGLIGTDLQLIFGEFMAQNALNLDGTLSSTLWIGSEGGLQNTPSSGAEIPVANAVLLQATVTPSDAGPSDADATTDASDDVASDAAPETSGPEDPTDDAGDVADASIYASDPGPTSIPQTAREDPAACACRTGTSSRSELAFVALAALGAACTRRVTRRGSRPRS